ncbi:MAG: hypothetical protein BWY82_02372 [Verrucomicrobia bacterium ADurb.Bin474]|nr:MAG: hypothetical protein BWY82_02372 [Verrucomicrobia bacterium ADurb.Bin474]
MDRDSSPVSSSDWNCIPFPTSRIVNFGHDESKIGMVATRKSMIWFLYPTEILESSGSK